MKWKLLFIDLLPFDPQIYTERYRPPARRNQQVQEVENHLADLATGSFVAIYLDNWNKTPVIGKVNEIKEESVIVQYWKGSWNNRWEPHFYHGQPWTNELPKTCIILSNFELVRDNRLGPETKKFLKNKYKELNNSNDN